MAVAAAEVEAFIARALRAAGLPEGDAAAVAGLMTLADLSGADGHGVFRLPQYVQRLQAGGMKARPEIRVERETAATALVNGDDAMGHLVMKFCAERAVAKAREAGIAWVGAHHSNHAGPAMLYAEMGLPHDMIGLYSAVASANHMPPWGGLALLLGTNPLAVALPAGEEPPVVLDMATTVAAYGKVKIARQRGEQMPEGWMIDREGRPLTDPNRADEGLLLPIGGPKGYGLAVVLGLLAGTLNGAAMGSEVVDFNADSATSTNTGQFVCMIDIAAFGEPADFKRRVDALARELRASPTLPGAEPVRLPGERSQRLRAERRRDGVPIPPPLRAQLDALAARLAVAPLAADRA